MASATCPTEMSSITPDGDCTIAERVFHGCHLVGSVGPYKTAVGTPHEAAMCGSPVSTPRQRSMREISATASRSERSSE